METVTHTHTRTEQSLSTRTPHEKRTPWSQAVAPRVGNCPVPCVPRLSVWPAAGVLGLLGAALAFPFRGSFLQFSRCHALNGSKSNAANHSFFSGARFRCANFAAYGTVLFVFADRNLTSTFRPFTLMLLTFFGVRSTRTFHARALVRALAWVLGRARKALSTTQETTRRPLARIAASCRA